MSQAGTFCGSTVSVLPVPVNEGGTGVTTLAADALIVGDGSSPVVSLVAATDGQIPIGNTGNPPTVAAITAGVGVTVTNGPGTITIDAAGVNQVNIFYVGKHGNDANDGLAIEKAFLTFGAAISAASSGDVLWCFDEGVYVENLTGASGISIYAQNAELTGAHTIAQNSTWSFGVFNVADLTTGVTFNSAGNHAHINARHMYIAGIGIGCLNMNGDLFVAIDNIELANGYFVGDTTSDKTHVDFREIIFTGVGIAFAGDTGGEFHIIGNSIENDGVAGNGTAFSSTGASTPVMNIGLANINVDKLSNITAGSEVRLAVAAIHGTAAEAGAGKIIVGGATRTDGVPIGAVTPSTGAFTTLTASTPIGVASGGTGVATLTDHGILLGSGVGAVTPLGAATNGQIPVGSTGADPVLANITSARDLLVTNGAGTLDITLDDNTHRTSIHGWNGAIIESPVVTVTSDGATITFSVEKSGGGDLTPIFSDGFYDWDTTPADTITLTAGSDTSPQANYVYFLQSTKALTVSTSAFPSAEHCPLATVLCQSAASLQTEGAYKVHAWTDHITDSVEQGHIAHLNAWIRNQNATYTSGVAQTLTITPNGGAPDNVIFTTAAGIVYQLHNHTFPSFAGTPDVYTVNDSGTAYNVVTDLNALLTDSTGASMSGRYFSLVIWGVVSEATGDCKLMVNLPGGSYGVAAQLGPDASRYANYSIPTEFKGTGFLISQLNLRHQVSASGTWTSIDEIDLRGFFPNLSAGASTSFATEFEDNTFRIIDDGDNTKELAFQVSGVTTATTRTITMADRDIDLDAVPDSFVTDSGTAVPSGGSITFTGTGLVSTSGASSTITINAAGFVWNEETTTSVTMAVENGYLSSNVAQVVATLPATAALGSVFRIAGKGSGGWKIAQQAGQTITWDETSATTTGVGGYLESTDDHDCVELVTMTADSDFLVISSKGNILIV